MYKDKKIHIDFTVKKINYLNGNRKELKEKQSK